MENVWAIMAVMWGGLIMALLVVLWCNPPKKWPPRDTTLLKVRSQIVRTIDRLDDRLDY